MPKKQTVYQIAPGQPNHGQPVSVFAVDAREMMALGQASTRPLDAAPVIEKDPVDPELNVLTKDQLLPLANELGVQNVKTLTKVQLMDAIAVHRAVPETRARITDYVNSKRTNKD